MKRKIVCRSLLGALLGVVINHAIAVAVSLAVGDGAYYAVTPKLITNFGSELNAVLIQTVIIMLYGAVWGGISTVWDMETWSMLRMTATHLILCFSATLPTAYILGWMGDDSVAGILVYSGIFLAIYACIWIFTYFSMKAHVKRMNEKLGDMRAPK